MRGMWRLEGIQDSIHHSHNAGRSKRQRVQLQQRQQASQQALRWQAWLRRTWPACSVMCQWLEQGREQTCQM